MSTTFFNICSKNNEEETDWKPQQKTSKRPKDAKTKEGQGLKSLKGVTIPRFVFHKSLIIKLEMFENAGIQQLNINR